MNKLFKDIRHSDIESVRAAISKNINVGAYPDIQEITKKRLFEILDLLIEYGADKEEWLNQDFWGVSNKVHFFEEKMYGMNNIDIREPIRIVLVLLKSNQGGKALKWLPAHFNFYGSVATSSGHFVPKSGVGRGTGDCISPFLFISPPAVSVEQKSAWEWCGF